MLKFKRLPHGVGLPLPAYQTDGAAGMDICAATTCVIAKGTHRMVSTGFAVAVPEGWELQCRPRSGLAAKKMVTVGNAPGTIDSDYRGEIHVILFNHGPDFFVINRGDRIAQLVPKQAPRLAVMEVDELDETVRGSGGFGSTGI